MASIEDIKNEIAKNETGLDQSMISYAYKQIEDMSSYEMKMEPKIDGT
jgi:hypothetical protein